MLKAIGLCPGSLAARQAIQRTADQLNAEALITFERNPEHGRSPLARPTPSGLAALVTITSAARDWNALAAPGLKPGDLNTARSVLKALSNAAHADAPTTTRELPD